MDESVEHLARQRAELAQEQAELEAQLAEVNRKLIGARRNLGQIHNTRTNDISVLPAEVLVIIFETLHRSQTLNPIRNPTPVLATEERATPWIRSVQGRDPPDNWKIPPTSVGHRAEVILSHVSNKWRVIALQTPSLWSVFSTYQDAAWNAVIISETKRFRTYLGRSGNHDLKLYFRFQRVVQPPTEADGTFWTLVKELLNVALGHIGRWKHFTIFAPRQDPGVWDVALTLRHAFARLYAPKLERLVVMLAPSTLAVGRLTIEGGGWDAQILLGDGGESQVDPCPSLKHLKLDRVSLVGFIPPLQHLTVLILEYGAMPIDANPSFLIDWNVLITGILPLPNLEAFSLCDDLMRLDTYPAGGTHWAEYRVDMPKLKDLRLSQAENSMSDAIEIYSSLYFLIRYITAPLLETLTLQGFNIDNPPWELVAEEWLDPAHIFPSLCHLTLIEVRVVNQDPITCAVFRQLAKLTRNVTTLVLSYRNQHLNESSIITMLLRWSPWADSQVPLEELWPAAWVVTFHFPPDLPGNGDVIRDYPWWRDLFYRWKKAMILSIPGECLTWVPIRSRWASRPVLPPSPDSKYDYVEHKAPNGLSVLVFPICSRNFPRSLPWPLLSGLLASDMFVDELALDPFHVVLPDRCLHHSSQFFQILYLLKKVLIR
ncbi:hypothetical protein DFP72DRAFT_887751 [Ephemerocybe angulata]|uniref:F-box domain-containing protein n=1 Tax=Ephemerocybe angulata TaxID=980116 RepID=A0A8H6MA92_9AGAR|nr:hypothetical protein DFP72DRAFT_887751 [Tulosesus angulatus]